MASGFRLDEVECSRKGQRLGESNTLGFNESCRCCFMRIAVHICLPNIVFCCTNVSMTVYLLHRNDGRNLQSSVLVLLEAGHFCDGTKNA